MALPKIEKPKITVKLPFGKFEITPMSVKELKVVSVAMQSEDDETILKEIVRVCKACCDNSDVIDTLTVSQLQMLFLEIRKNSAGHVLEAVLTCSNPECGSSINAKIDLNDVVYKEAKETEKKIMITDKLGLMLKLPTVKKFLEIGDGDYPIVRMVIDYVFDENDVYEFSDNSVEEQIEFIESLPTATISQIEEFVENLDATEYEKDWKCMACGEENKLYVTGVIPFFK